jgi:hypothetical protein
MKKTLFLTILCLCLFSVYVAGEETAKKKSVDEVLPVETYYRSFEMINGRGDSAWCKIKYTPTKATSRSIIDSVLDIGESKRRNIFENDDAFEKIIDRTLLGGSFSDYNKIKMSDCRLCKKGSSKESDVPLVLDSEEPPIEKNIEKKALDYVEENEKKMESKMAFGIGSETQVFINIPYKDIALIFLAIMVVVLVVFIFLKRRQMKAYIKSETDSGEIIEEKDRKIKELEDRCDRQTIKISDLEGQIRKLTEDINRFKIGAAPLNTGLSGDVPAVVAPVVQPVLSPMTRKTIEFFFSNPIGNSFNASKSTDVFVDGKSLYRFERIDGESSADISVVNVPSVVQRFIQSSEAQMGVCEFVGGYNKNATNIDTVEVGSAVLDDGKWTIKKKIKIRYS